MISMGWVQLVLSWSLDVTKVNAGILALNVLNCLQILALFSIISENLATELTASGTLPGHATQIDVSTARIGSALQSLICRSVT